jgi:hypothetical protein
MVCAIELWNSTNSSSQQYCSRRGSREFDPGWNQTQVDLSDKKTDVLSAVPPCPSEIWMEITVYNWKKRTKEVLWDFYPERL